MLTFTKKYSRNSYSQNGEDGIIEECLRRMGLFIGTCVEFGAADGYYCSNTRALANKGWGYFMYDLTATLDVQKKEITPDNVNELPKCNVLSIDCDGPDFGIWKAYNGNPDIVIIEINSSVMATDDGPVSDSERGTAYKPMVELGISKGYFLLCHTGNLIFVRNEYRKLFPEVIGNGVDNWQLYFQTKWLTQ
jgi:hypothetical protein